MSEDQSPPIPQEHWVEGHLNLSPEQFNDGYLNDLVDRVVRPTLDRHWDAVETFHFLTEPRTDDLPGIRLLFRVEVQEAGSQDTVSETLRDLLDRNDDLLDRCHLTEDYAGEADDYGPDGWDIMKRLMQVGSEAHLARTSEDKELGPKFDLNKLTHCYLNAQMVDEETFHLQSFVLRAAINMAESSTPSGGGIQKVIRSSREEFHAKLDAILDQLEQGGLRAL